MVGWEANELRLERHLNNAIGAGAEAFESQPQRGQLKRKAP